MLIFKNKNAYVLADKVHFLFVFKTQRYIGIRITISIVTQRLDSERYLKMNKLKIIIYISSELISNLLKILFKNQ